MPIPTNWNDAFFDEKRQIGDPLADEAIQQLIDTQGNEAAQALFNTLINDIDLPVSHLPALQSYLNQTKQLPDWADWEQINQGYQLFLDHGAKFLVFLYYKSLPQLYTNAKGATVLTRTSRLTNEDQSLKIFARRIAETGDFLLDVMGKDALKPSGLGIQAIQKIRLIHAAIRYFYPINAAEKEQLGVPINQEDMAMTLMTFSITLIDALDQFEIDAPQAQLEGYLHTWKAIGINLGIHEDLLPNNLAEARQLYRLIEDRQAAASKDGQLLAQALIQFSERFFDTPKLKPIPRLLIQFLIGPEQAKNLGIQEQLGCLGRLLPKIIGTLFQLGERIEDWIEGTLPQIITVISKTLVRKMVEYFDNYKTRGIHPHDQFFQHWLEEE